MRKFFCCIDWTICGMAGEFPADAAWIQEGWKYESANFAIKIDCKSRLATKITGWDTLHSWTALLPNHWILFEESVDELHLIHLVSLPLVKVMKMVTIPYQWTLIHKRKCQFKSKQNGPLECSRIDFIGYRLIVLRPRSQVGKQYGQILWSPFQHPITAHRKGGGLTQKGGVFSGLNA